jgi:hypothetical protein
MLVMAVRVEIQVSENGDYEVLDSNGVTVSEGSLLDNAALAIDLIHILELDI